MVLSGEVKTVVVDEAGSAANELVAAVSGKAIRILALALLSDSAVDVTIQDDTGGGAVVLIGPLGDINKVSFVLPFSEEGWGQTTRGQALDMLLGGATQTTGVLVYAEV
jgi:hypothetical protein